MPIPNSIILKDDVVPKPVRAEEPAFPRTDVKTKLASLRPVITIVLLLASLCAAQTPPTPTPDATKPIPFLAPLPQDTGLPGLKQQLRKLQTTGRLMMVVAHPDDEDGGTLTLEARGKGVQTLLLTLTRGEGGQNELGTGLFDKLGILRTLELLASDKYYGVEQRFTRVADFGYSKTPEETFQKWGGHDVPLADIVRVIRTFRPDVLVARFSGTDNDGHGHHQASAILTREAFRAAADPNRFPEQIKEGLHPWQAKKLYIGNVCGFRSNTCADENWTVKLDAGEVDPVLGMSYAQMAADGLAHQRSQGHGGYKVSPGPHNSFYKLVDSVLPNTKDAIGHEKDFLDGIDTSFRPPEVLNSLTVDPLTAAKFDIDKAARNTTNDPSTAFGPLLDALMELNRVSGIRAELSDIQTLTTRLQAKEDQLRAAINLALRVSAEAVSDGPSAVSPRDQVKFRVRFQNGSRYNVRTSYAGPLPRLDVGNDPVHIPVLAGQQYSRTLSFRVPDLSSVETRPYWHRQNPETDSVNIIDNPQFQTLPFPPSLNEDVAYTVPHHATPQSGPSWLVPWPGMSAPLVAEARLENGKLEKQQLAVVPPFSVALEPSEQILPVADGKETAVKVGVSSNLTGAPAGTLHLDLPAGWRAEPDSLKVSLPKRGDQQDFTFKVFPANLKEGRSEIRAVLDAGGTKYAEGYTLVTREDLGSAYYFQPAVQRVSIVDVKIPANLKLGYILGAGDDIPTVLQQIGMNVTIIPAEKIATDNLAQYNTVVLGVRAYDAQKDVVANSQEMLDYVSNGGTLVVQHNNDMGAFNSAHFTPYPATLGRTRVSVEEAPVTILAPDNEVFHYPNEISQRDFDGWVQERGLYFMDKWDDHYTPLISCHDPNEPDQKGGLLYAKYGKGIYIYSGYAFYRQLPAGVSGAIRLFVNIVSAGAAASSH